MIDYKIEAAKAALKFIKPGQVIGLGAGSTVAHLIDLIRQHKALAASIVFVSSSFKTNAYLLHNELNVQSPLLTRHIDIYFDGCDQFDKNLNALKSGGGIHTTEKILAAMAAAFILMGDEGKYVEKLDITYPLVVEILPVALHLVQSKLADLFPDAAIKLRMSSQKDGALISENGNYLADIYFKVLKDLQTLDIEVNMIPGIVAHSLFYRMAGKAIIAGKDGVRIISQLPL
ncbi:MAG TPA: ribose 5-phosphate isomerase A [Pedobacter sp.]|nr:ribose 5-phosphate isomerase A [Pedobacter sp.]